MNSFKKELEDFEESLMCLADNHRLSPHTSEEIKRDIKLFRTRYYQVVREDKDQKKKLLLEELDKQNDMNERFENEHYVDGYNDGLKKARSIVEGWY
jgi:hypothetical protein